MICFGISGQPPTSWACWRTPMGPSWPRTTWGSTLEQIFWNESGWVPFDNMPEGIFWQSPTLWARWQSQMCPFWSPKCVHLDPEKKGPGRTRHLVRALSKCPRCISIPWNRLQCWPTGTKSYTVVQTEHFDRRQGPMSRWATRNTFLASLFNVYTTFI